MSFASMDAKVVKGNTTVKTGIAAVVRIPGSQYSAPMEAEVFIEQKWMGEENGYLITISIVQHNKVVRQWQKGGKHIRIEYDGSLRSPYKVKVCDDNFNYLTIEKLESHDGNYVMFDYMTER